MSDQMAYEFREWFIPAHMMDGIQRYISDRVPPGDFLYAVLTNDLSEACNRADDTNLRNLPAYVAYLYNEAPSTCWGSADKVNAWLASRYETRASEESAA